MITLRDYQNGGVDAVRGAFRAGRRAPLLVMPTGGGKTVCFSFISAGASRLGNRVTIVAHRYELLKQISDALSAFDVPHGMISPGHREQLHERVQVAGVQALAARIKRKPEGTYKTDLLIIDEAHHVRPDNSWGLVFDALGRPRVLGVTASPIRSDGRGLGVATGGVFDELIDVISAADLIEQAYLARPVVYAPSLGIDLSGLHMRAGDFVREELEAAVDKPTITGDAIAHWKRLCPGVTTVAFGVSIEHCQHIAAQFRAAGYNFQVADGKMEKEARAQAFAGLGRGITGLVSCDLIGEGVDIPAIGCAILMRPTMSLGLHIQQMGRPMRPIYAAGFDLSSLAGRRLALAAGKETTVILDHVGNVFRHGLPQTVREWSLDGEVKRKGKKSETLGLKQCGECYAMFQMPADECPHCGAPIPVASREVEQVAGELAEVTPEMAASLQALAQAKRREVQATRTLDGLKKIEQERGYSPGWADSVFGSRKRAAQNRVESQEAAYARR